MIDVARLSIPAPFPFTPGSPTLAASLAAFMVTDRSVPFKSGMTNPVDVKSNLLCEINEKLNKDSA
jgi:hypothetical protein